MKLLTTTLLASFFFTASPVEDKITASNLELKGVIDGENVTFTMAFEVDVNKSGSVLDLVEGDVAYVSDKLPGKAKISREGKTFRATFDGRVSKRVEFSFASLPVKDKNWRHTTFRIPNANIRKLSMVCDRDDLEVDFPGALSVDRKKNFEGKTEVTAYLGVSDTFLVRWKPEVKKLDAELVVACDANTIATANVGALRMDTLFNYRVVQGSLTRLVVDLPGEVNVTRVVGEDIREWTINDDPSGGRHLEVVLNRPKEKTYLLQVENELVLPPFPNQFDLPVLQPRNVIRTSGFLMMGTDSAIKMLSSKASGLTQVDQASFPAMQGVNQSARATPKRTSFAYQYANMPYTLTLAADDIVTAFSADERLVLSLKDRDLTFNAVVEMDVRDAPAREAVVETDPDWIVVNVEGRNVADYDVREEKGRRLIQVYFKDGVMGKTLFNVRMEKSLPEKQTSFKVPGFNIRNARTERGFLVLSAEKGVRLKPGTLAGLREVHTGSLPIRVVDAQVAYRFKTPDWKLLLDVEATSPALYSEVFHLVSLGEGVLYGSSTITYHVTGAPVRDFKLSIPETYSNVEFTGADVRGWKQEGTEWTVSLQEKVIGDYTLLVTYDRQFQYEGDEIQVGGLTTIGSENELGYIALAGSSSIGVEKELRMDPTLIGIDRMEIPEEYAMLINDPVVRAYKYVNAPHSAVVRFKRFPTQPLLGQVNDHTTLTTRISEEGEAVTTVLYFVKNTSQQYLGITLPEGASLWSATVDGVKVQVLDTSEGKGKVLVPLHRHPDPNQPSRVELVYAQSFDRLGWHERIKLQGPVSMAQSIFAKWTVDLPDDFTISSEGGNMLADGSPRTMGLRGLALALLQSGRTLVTQSTAWLVAFAVFIVSLSLVVFNFTRRRGRIWGVVVGVVLTAITGLVALANDPGIHDLQRCMELPTTADPSLQAFTKVVSLADSGLQVSMQIVPSWIGSGGSLYGFAGGLVLGVFLLLRGLFHATRRRAYMAAGLTIVTYALAESAATMTALIVGITLLIPLAVLIQAVRGSRNMGRRYLAAHPLIEEEPPPLVHPEVDPETVPPAPDGQEGSAPVLLLILMALLFSGMPLLAEKTAHPPPQKPAEPKVVVPVLDSVEIDVTGPSTKDKEDQIARIKAVYEFEAEEESSFLLLTAAQVLTDYELSSTRYLKIDSSAKGYELVVHRGGKYKVTLQFLAPVQEKEGTWRLGLYLPENLRNRVVLRLPETGLDIQSEQAVLLKTEDKAGGLESTAVFGPASRVDLVWQPQVRKTELEEAVFFCEMNSFAAFESGVVNLTHHIQYQIAQGEIQKLRMTIPEGMSVTAVTAVGLSTWRYDPNTQELVALLDKPVSGNLALAVVTQIPQEGLPYTVSFAMPEIKDCSRQRGSIAVAAPDTVQIGVDKQDGLNTMNLGDFSEAAVKAAAGGSRAGRPAEVKRAFRYHKMPVQLAVEAEQVMPELRLVEQSHLDISDERIFLTSKLMVNIAKSGIFTLKLNIPDLYDVESLTGEDISHWDEIKENGQGVMIHFKKQVLGDRVLNLVISRTEKGIGESITVPRVRIADALKHTGSLTVAGEHGVRFMTVKREGVSEINPKDLGIKLPGYLAFRLLRPTWSVELKTEVVDAVVKSEVLQKVDLSEGLAQVNCILQYKIDGAGIKKLELQSPQPGLVLSVFGRDIAHVQEIDAEKGIWQVSLHNKVENTYQLEVSYQVPFDATARRVQILPIKTIRVQSQKGYLVVMAGGRIQVKPENVTPGLSEVNARNIPATMGAGDLSNAILSYRATRDDYNLDLSVVRHDSASVLPATVKKARLTSVVSDDDQMVTRVEMDLQVGDLRFLKASLPKNSQVWSVFINGKASTPLVQEDNLLIPLDAALDAETSIEFIYAGRARAGLLSRKRKYEGPQFDLPLTDIQWSLYVPPRYRYYGFDGTMQYLKTDSGVSTHTYDVQQYTQTTKQEVVKNLKMAERVLDIGNKYAAQGNTVAAKQAFEAAMNYSVGQDDFNEDARVQYRNAAKEQAKVSLWNRRGRLKKRSNIVDEVTEQQVAANQMAQTVQVEQYLSTKDNDALEQVAEKILDQQAAAEELASNIRVILPLQGQKLDFYRELQIRPFSEMVVSFKTISGRGTQWIISLAMALVLFLGYRALVREPGQAHTA